ncbi:hypothetical protein F2Q69_00029146 [Brassica cretica]|uniref:Uncharacterized protein n=1 Tax=Brassica cretica TaxID=69181 RepID=A0A8S9RZU6_BRACR|nr:hypothetical protein F2Q69_00029146 [Brassica cretica]
MPLPSHSQDWHQIDEMVFGICGAQEKLGEELKTLVEDTHQPLDRGYNELFRCMAEMRTEIESLRQQLEKEATTSTSIDAPHATSIDVSLPTAQIPAEPQCSTQHRDEWEVSYIDTRINDVYCPLNNNVDWLSTKIELLQQDLDTIHKKDQQPATSIDMCTFTSLDAKISAMNERLRTYEDMHDRFISPAKSSSIDRLRGPWIDGKKPVELLPYTAAEKEVKAIQRQLAAQHQISASIDRTLGKSIDGNSPRSTNEHIIASIDAESKPIGEQLIHKTVESMQKELTDLSAYAYDNIGWHQVSIDNVQERLQNTSNVLEKMDDKWTRNDEATRNSTKDAKADQPINYTLALNRMKDTDGNARAMDGRILQVSRGDIADILQVANGPDNLFSQQRGTLDVIQTDPNNHAGVTTAETNPDLSRQPKGQASIDGTTETSIDRVTPTSIDMDEPTSIDRRYECGNRAFDMYGARKFTWEQREEYGVYRDERGHARGAAGEMIPVTKDNIRKILERASLFEESHICLPEHATSFTLTRLAPELYTKEEIDEMVFGICGAQEKLGEELKTLVDDTHQPLDRGYNELFRCMADMRTEFESLRQQLEKEATTSASIDAPRATSIDVSLPTAQIPAEPQCSTQHR